MYVAVMMIKGYRLLIELKHILMDTRAGKVGKTELLTKVNIK